MTNHQILKAFEIEIGLIDDNVNKPLTADSLYWLNQAVHKFVKTRYNRDVVHNTGYEQNEKRFKDLRNLISSKQYLDSIPFDSIIDTVGDVYDQTALYGEIVYCKDLDTFLCRQILDHRIRYYSNWTGLYDYQDGPYSSPREDTIYSIGTKKYIYSADTGELVDFVEDHQTYYSIDIEYPDDFLFTLNEDVLISNLDGGDELWTCVFECTADSFMYRITNSLTDFHYKHKKARPIRIRTATGCQLLTDKNYSIQKYKLGYIRKPNPIVLGENKDDEYTEFEDSIIHEIIKMAAQMYLENSGNERYKSITQEVLTQE